MSIFNRTEEDQKMMDRVENIRGILRQQISGVIDSRRSKEYWKNILEKIPHEAIADALSSELTHFNYHEVTRSRCCCRV